VRSVLTATLRNLARGGLPNFWRAVEREGLPIFTHMLSSARPTAQENAAALLASYLTAPPPAAPALLPLKPGTQPQQQGKGGSVGQAAAPEEAAARLVQSGTVPVLLSLMEPGREVAVRKEAAGVLRAATEASEVARQAVVDCGGVPVLIRAVVAPAQEMMASAHAQRLQENAMAALTHIAGGARGSGVPGVGGGAVPRGPRAGGAPGGAGLCAASPAGGGGQGAKGSRAPGRFRHGGPWH